MLAFALYFAYRALSLAHEIAARDRRRVRRAIDRAGSYDHRHAGETARLSHRVHRQMASGHGLADPQEQRALLSPSKQPDDEVSKANKKAAAAAAVATEPQIAFWREVFSKPIAGGPTTRGFDLYFGTSVPNWPPFCFIENDHTVGIPTEFLPQPLMGNNQASMQGPALKGWKLEGILPALGDRAIRFINESVQKKDPFLVFMPLTSPHTPLSVNPEWKGKSGLNLFADFVMETDAVVGRVLEALEKSGAAGNTLVIFTADNGCAPYIGVKDLEQMGHYPSGPLRGYKADAWEGGHRVPFIVRWPGVVKPGSVCNQLVYQADFLRTFADVFGVKLPDSAGEDSFSLMPLLKGEDKPVRENAVSASINGVPAVRSGSWKYIPSPGWAAGALAGINRSQCNSTTSPTISGKPRISPLRGPIKSPIWKFCWRN